MFSVSSPTGGCQHKNTAVRILQILHSSVEITCCGLLSRRWPGFDENIEIYVTLKHTDPNPKPRLIAWEVSGVIEMYAISNTDPNPSPYRSPENFLGKSVQ